MKECCAYRSTRPKPAADAAQRFLGPIGASMVAGGALVSIYGYLSANLLHAPRLTFAMGEQGDFPRCFAAVHSRFRTPYVSIVLFAVLVVGLFRGRQFSLERHPLRAGADLRLRSRRRRPSRSPLQAT